MNLSPYATAIRHLRSAFDGGAVAGLTDGQLLDRFARRGGDEVGSSAFAALVARHGPMVLHVCRSALRDEHDAQDAFQAVFIILVRKAATTLGPRTRSAPGSTPLPCGPRPARGPPRYSVAPTRGGSPSRPAASPTNRCPATTSSP